MPLCNYCQKEYSKYGLKNHISKSHLNPKSNPYVHIGRIAAGQARSIEAEEIRREKIRDYANKRNFGGYVRGSGRGKKGWYKGYFCDSSWELAWIVYNIDHGIKFKRNWKKFPYLFEGKICNWIPDFVIDDNTYIEIKGYDTLRNKAKRSEFQDKLIVLFEKDLRTIFEYVISVYGKDYIKLYES